ncbi:MAG: GNAT family N-acetyltransferase [Ruminococcaceae bacterium]|nr:GNAT family N-acetyltransferase [Oscillospiraceae bacterium]
MEFVLLTEEQKQEFFQDILHMMQLSDKDFVPPLSERSSTTQSSLAGQGEKGEGSVLNYLSEMIHQPILAAVEDGKILEFISFKENYVTDGIDEKDLPNIYLSTLILHPDGRGRGLTKQLYGHLFNELYADRNIFTRTWSTNVPHIKILSFFGFEELKRLKDHRGAGIDTVYYVKRRF